MAIDSHTHINSLVLSNPNQEIQRINEDTSLSQLINVSLNIKTAEESIAISEHNPKFYSTVGIHPLYIENQDLEELIKLARHNKVVAIGEIGLDYYYDNSPREVQKEWFKKQIFE